MKFKVLLIAICILGIANINASAQCSINSTPSHNCASFNDQIDAIKINNISSPHSSGCSSGGHGGPFNTPGWSFVPGVANSFTVVVGGGSYREALSIWIDLNQNGFYESSERVYASSTWDYTHTSTFTVPTTATSGMTYMRVMCAYTSGQIPAGNACSNYYGTWGEFEDYEVSICNPPSILQQPLQNFACEDGKGMMVVSAANADGYVWQVDAGNGWSTVTPSNVYSNVNGDTLRLDNTPSTLNGVNFRAIVFGCGGGIKDTTDPAKLDVYPITTVESQTIIDTSCVGLNTALYVKTKGVINNYQWQIYNPIDSTYYDISNNPFVINFDTLNVIGIADTLDGAIIRVIANGQCGIDTSQDITMVVHPLPAIADDPVDITADPGDDVRFDITASGVNVKYQWQVGYQGTFANVNNNGIYSGVKTDRIDVTGVSRAQNEYQFRCIVKGSGSCAVDPDTSDIGMLFVNFPASVGTLGSESTISLYPNPVNGASATLQINDIPEAKSYAITNKIGKLISKGIVNNNGTTTLELSNLASDVYHIQISDNQGTALKTIQFTKL